jgi:hypothetical protein
VSIAYKVVAVVGEVSNLFDFHWRDFVCDLILSAVAKLVDMVRPRRLLNFFFFLLFFGWRKYLGHTSTKSLMYWGNLD